jgi:hypothetical protein
LTVIWALLLGATLFSVESAGGLFPKAPAKAVAVVVIVMAFIKVRFVGLEFMELRHAPRLARLAFEAWVAILSMTIIAVLLLGISVAPSTASGAQRIVSPAVDDKRSACDMPVRVRRKKQHQIGDVDRAADAASERLLRTADSPAPCNAVQSHATITNGAD